MNEPDPDCWAVWCEFDAVDHGTSTGSMLVQLPTGTVKSEAEEMAAWRSIQYGQTRLFRCYAVPSLPAKKPQVEGASEVP